MANVLGLAMKVSADASGFPKALTPVEKALGNLSKEAERSTAVLDKFAAGSAAAAAAQGRAAADFQKLADALKNGLDPQEYARQFAALQQATRDTAAAFEEGIRVTEANRTAEERRATELERLRSLLDLGAIDQETYNRATAEASGANEAAAAAERERADAAAAAARIIQANLTPQERYDQQVQELVTHLNAGRLSQEQFDRALASTTAAFTKAESAAKGYDRAVDAAGKGGTLKFNELSGVLSALPGPLGSVAGRISGLASAGEGLSRVFAGGLSSGISGIGSSLVGLVNPVTAAVAGVAALGAAATAVVSGLSNMEAEAERLQNAADKLGVSFDFIQTVEQAAKMAGIEFGTVNTAMTKLLKTLAGADEESKQATAALGRLGISLADIEDKGSEEQLRIIGERLQAIEDPAKRAAAATAIFGKSGAELLPFFNNLGIAEQTLTRFNARLNEVDATRVLSLGDSFDAVKASLTGVGNELLTPFIGITQSISDGLAPTIAAFGRNLGALLDIFSPLTSAIGGAINVVLQLGSVISNAMGTVLEPFAAVGRTIASVFDAQSQGLTKVFGAVNDAVIGFREFFKFDAVAAQFRDVIGQIGQAFDKVAEIVGRVATIVGTALSQLGTAIGQTFGTVVETVGGGVSKFLEFVGLGGVVSSFASTVSEAFGGLWQGIKDIVGRVGGFIEQVLTFAEDWLGIKREVEQPVVATVTIEGTEGIQAVEEYTKDFQNTLDGVTKSVSDAINESAKFGQAGFDAAAKYQTAIAELKERLDNGFFNEETFRREAEKAGAAFKDELARIEEDAKLEIQIESDAQKTLAGLNSEVDKAIQGAQQFGQEGFDAALQFQNKIEELRQQFEDGVINTETLRRGVDAANDAYDTQIDKIKQVQDEQKRLIEADKGRVDELLKVENEITKLESDILAVQRDAQRTAEEITAARDAGNAQAAEAAAARLAQIDQLQAKLDEQLQAAEQGFTEGFAKAFEGTNAGIATLVQRATEFGTTGAMAARELQEGIARAQQQARDGILTRETYEREIAQQQQIFQQRLEGAKRVEDFLRSKLTERQRLELESAKAIEERKKQAALNVKAIEDRILANKEEVEKARANNDLKAARAKTGELRQLQALQRQEQQIADGRQQATQRAFNQQSQQQAAFANLAQQQFSQQQNAIRSAVDQTNNAFAAAANKQREFLRQLNTLGSRTVETADVRTQEGAALVLGLAANAQDPALIEARLQTKLQRQLVENIGQTLNRIGLPVLIP